MIVKMISELHLMENHCTFIVFANSYVIIIGQM